MNEIRIRTINQAYRQIKEMDPQSCISETMIRSIVREGKIGNIKRGNRKLINFDALLEYLSQDSEQESIAEKTGIIRRIGI